MRWIRIKDIFSTNNYKDYFTLLGITEYFLDHSEYARTMTGVIMSIDNDDKIFDIILDGCNKCNLSIEYG